MALDIVAQDLVVDETSGLQDDDTSTTNTTINYLLSLDAAGGLSSPQVAFQADFVIASASAGETISSIVLTKNAAGDPFSTTVGVNSNLRTVDGNYIWLFQDATHSNVVIGVIGTSDPATAPLASGPLAFSFALVATNATHADLYTVQYVPLFHPDATNPDDQIDLLNKVFASVAATKTVNFSQLGDAPPGHNDWYILDADVASAEKILVTARDNGVRDEVNVSTQGLGVSSQDVRFGRELQIDLITGGTQSAGKNFTTSPTIAPNYTAHLENVSSAGFSISQSTPTNSVADIEVHAYNNNDNAKGADFATDDNDTEINITGVTFKLNGVPKTAADLGITIDLSGNALILHNVGVGVTIDFTTAGGAGGTFDRFTIKNVDGEKDYFDVQEVHFSGQNPNAYTEQVGSFINFDDDGPAVTAVASANFVQHDETAGVQNGGADPDDKDIAGTTAVIGSTTVATLFAGVSGTAIGYARSGGSLLQTPGGSYGADGAGSLTYALSIASAGIASGVSTTGGTQIFLYAGSGATAGLILGRVGNEVAAGDTPNASGAIAFALGVNPATGETFIAQYLSLSHGVTTDNDDTISLTNTAVQMSAARSDGDNDSVSASDNVGAQIRFDDDGPAVTAVASTSFVQHDETAGVQNGGADPDDKDILGTTAVIGSTTVATLFAGVSGTAIGYARSGGSLLQTPGGSYGSDGAGSLTYALSVASTGIASGVSTTGGTQIFLYAGSGTTEGMILGRVGNEVAAGDTPNASGAIAFALAVNPATGETFIAQYLSLSHGVTTDNDDTISLTNTAVLMSAIRSDGDNDSISASDNVGAQIRFDDDGPTVGASPSTNFVQHDETPGVQNGGGDASDKDVAGSDFITGSSGPTIDSLFAGVSSSGDPDVTPKDSGNSIGFARSGASLLTAPTGSFGSDGAGSVPLSYALSVSDGTYSGVSTTGGTQIFLYNGSGTTAGLILGRVGNEVAAGDTPNASGAIAFALAVNSGTGEAYIAQYLSLSHGDTGSNDDTIFLTAGAVQMSVTRTDGDSDAITDSDNNVGDLFKFDDDGPTVTAVASTNFVQHDETAGVQNGGTDPDDKDILGSTAVIGSTTVATLFAGVSGTTIGYARSGGSLLQTPGGSNGSDGAGSLTYALSVASTGVASGVSTTGGTQIFLYAGSGTTEGMILGRVGNEVAAGDTPNASGAIAFALAVNPATGETFIAQYLSLSHGDTSDNDDTISLTNTAVLMSAIRSDGDSDSVSASDNVGAQIRFDDDGPAIGPVSDGIVDFIKDAFVTKSLLGAIGSDTKTSPYTLTDWTGKDAGDPAIVVNGVTLKAVANAGATSVTYWADTGGDTIFGNTGDTAYYRLDLSQTANSGAGSYTFTVLLDPPPAFVPFDFTDLPSGQNLLGAIARDKADLTKGGIFVMPTNPNINDGQPGESNDGTMTNTSGTVNTSKGGGPVTIGSTNQAFDSPSEGAWFVYVDNPDQGMVGGLGLNPTSADDADTVKFDGTIEVTNASVEIVQASGMGTTKKPGPALHIFAYDLNPQTVGHLGDAGVETDSRNFVMNPTATDDQVNIIGVKIYDAAGKLIEFRSNLQNGSLLNNGSLNDTDDAGTGVSGEGGSDDSAVVIEFNRDSTGATSDNTDDIYSATVRNLKAGYTIEWVTSAVHDAAKVEWVFGSYDIGGFNLLQTQPTPDQMFEFTAQATDGDGDFVSDSWKVGIDGTGPNDDGAVTGVAPTMTLLSAAKPSGFIDDSGMALTLARTSIDTLDVHNRDYLVM